jgi:hypothetical protein
MSARDSVTGSFDVDNSSETDTTLYPKTQTGSDETDITLYSTPRAINNLSAYVGGSAPVTDMMYRNDPPASGVNLGSLDSTSSFAGFKGYIDKILTGKGSAGDYAGLAALIYGLSGGNKPSASPGWRGKIDPNKYTYNRKPVAQSVYVPYSGSSAPVMGRQHFEDATYTKKAAEGGIMGLARGGSAKRPRYLEGASDGMADELSTSIDGEQPAALSHGEFVIPADVVSHLGNGNSKAGAQQLYKMMDRIRQARTGNKKQGKRINPDKFTPGGIAGYAGGGVVSFATGGTPTVTSGQGTAGSNPVTSESNLSEWAAPGVVDYIERGTALARQPYQAYKGPLVAGTSPLQTQVFSDASKLAPSANLGKAATMIDTAGTNLGKLSYNATPVSSAYTAPTGYSAGAIGNTYTGTGAYNPQATSNQFTGPADYKAGIFDSQYKGTDPYAASEMQLDKFNTANMQQYMNPYLQMSLDPQIAEARRQSQITQMGNASKLAQAGAYGGSRGALMDTETQRNLLQNLAAITGQGYNTAFDKATSAFNTQQGLGLQTQQANEASRQFGASQGLANAQNTAQYGMAALNAGEASRQFGANQAMTGAQNKAQYGQAAQQLAAQQQQFGASQALANAQNAAQYGLAGFTANEQAKQAQGIQGLTAAQQQAQYGQAAQQLNAQQQQFGANLGLSGLQGQLNAGTALGGLGMQEGQLGLANLNTMSNLGTTQRGIEQQGIDALYKQYEQERLDPYKQLQFEQSLYSGLPLSTITGSTATTGMQDLLKNIGLSTGVRDTINGPVPG